MADADSCIHIKCNAPRCTISYPERPCADVAPHCVQGHVMVVKDEKEHASWCMIHKGCNC